MGKKKPREAKTSTDTATEPQVKPPAAEAASSMQPSPLLAKLRAGHEKHFGKNRVYSGKTTNQYTTVLPYTPLMMQYLMGYSGLPIRQFLFLAGPEKSYKTSMLLEMMRWTLESGAMYNLPSSGLVINTEHKWSDTKSRAVLRDKWLQHFGLISADAYEEWQDGANRTMEMAKDMVDNQTKDSPAGMLFLGIDSLVGSQTEEMQKKVREGNAGRGFYDRAQRMWQWVQTQGSLLRNIPAVVVFTNHQTDAIDQISTNPNFKPKKVSGGAASGFHCALDFRMRTVGKISNAREQGYWLQLAIEHNTFGPKGRKIKVPYIEDFDVDPEDPTDFMQVDEFRWGEALVLQLQEWCKTARKNYDKPDIPELVRDVLGNIPEASGGRGKANLYGCDRLGIKASDGLTAQELGQKIEADEDLVRELRVAMRIARKTTWTPGMEF